MIPVYQEHPYHAPERGLFGDCYRAALASLLELPLADVPNFVSVPEDRRREVYREFLEPLGLIPVNIPGPVFKQVIRLTRFPSPSASLPLVAVACNSVHR